MPRLLRGRDTIDCPATTHTSYASFRRAAPLCRPVLQKLYRLQQQMSYGEITLSYYWPKQEISALDAVNIDVAYRGDIK